jgi:hypothetical protein
MAERELRIMSFVRGDYLMGTCTECKTTFMVALADDLKTAKDQAQAAFEKHEYHAAPDAQKLAKPSTH